MTLQALDRTPGQSAVRCGAAARHTPSLLARLVAMSLQLLAFVAGPAGAAAISGTVFEDPNYGGGAGRSLAAASGVPRASARVELYDATGAFSTATSTNGSGAFNLSGLGAGTYFVRVVNASVSSSRSGYVAGVHLAVQTHRTDATSGTPVAVTDFVGGTNPAVADPGNAGVGASFNTSTFAFTSGLSGTAQSVTRVALGVADVSQADFGFCFDVIVNTNGAGQGSLRQLLVNSNALLIGGLAQVGRSPGVEHAIWMIPNGTASPGLRAAFNLFGGSIALIAPTTALPAIADPLALDAQTQPGWTSAPIVRLDGSAATGAVDGLSVAASGLGTEIRGLIVTRFSRDGVSIQAGAGGVTVAGCWIGSTGNGSTLVGNADDGIEIAGGTAHIGGIGPYDGNVITNNGDEGINISGGGAVATVILGNIIGLDPNGASGGGNGDVGIAILAGANDTIGGPLPAARNSISRNYEGIEIGTPNNVIIGNYVGTDVTGTLDRGQRSDDGIELINGAVGNRIGGTGAADGNLIAFNALNGVNVAAGSGNAVLGNRIHSNQLLGIDLRNDGVSPNNGTVAAGQPNLSMDSPVFTSAVLSFSTLTLAGYVGSAPGQATFANARVELFRSDLDGTGFGEGRSLLGSLTTNATGQFSGILSVSGLVAGDQVTGTATDGSGNTSEFGADRVVTAGGGPLAITKRAFLPGGTPLNSGMTLPRGTRFQFMLYVSNNGPAVNDVTLRDLLDPAFEYEPGSLRVTMAPSNCLGANCTAAEEATMYALSAAAPSSSDGIDGDVAAFSAGTVHAGNQNVANARLDVPANRACVLLFTVHAR
ncbi:MAG: T9SS type A sorting domain-containing protein [Candidatus Eisenbacteria bacterium]|uniref:T9SS type A sorting domain-containing protein n=1 Tax=Eiseniibacteriota bacterium TaxID=2212470 RepID=A0A849SLJ4_UNCEI|nr:T9SS type A sorting domain-containing protein [Candidatus Eisenbacteria bacterium]